MQLIYSNLSTRQVWQVNKAASLEWNLLDHAGQELVDLALAVAEIAALDVVAGLHAPAVLGVVELREQAGKLDNMIINFL